MIRSLLKDDFDKVKEIHEKFYKTEFDLPNFLDKYLCAFAVEDEDTNEVISLGGIRTIVESIVMTNKDFSPRDRRKALLEILAASLHFTEKFKYNQIHAFVQESDWEHHLRKVGFKDINGKGLVLSL